MDKQQFYLDQVVPWTAMRLLYTDAENEIKKLVRSMPPGLLWRPTVTPTNGVGVAGWSLTFTPWVSSDPSGRLFCSNVNMVVDISTATGGESTAPPNDMKRWIYVWAKYRQVESEPVNADGMNPSSFNYRLQDSYEIAITSGAAAATLSSDADLPIPAAPDNTGNWVAIYGIVRESTHSWPQNYNQTGRVRLFKKHEERGTNQNDRDDGAHGIYQGHGGGFIADAVDGFHWNSELIPGLTPAEPESSIQDHIAQRLLTFWRGPSFVYGVHKRFRANLEDNAENSWIPLLSDIPNGNDAFLVEKNVVDHDPALDEIWPPRAAGNQPPVVDIRYQIFIFNPYDTPRTLSGLKFTHDDHFSVYLNKVYQGGSSGANIVGVNIAVPDMIINPGVNLLEILSANGPGDVAGTETANPSYLKYGTESIRISDWCSDNGCSMGLPAIPHGYYNLIAPEPLQFIQATGLPELYGTSAPSKWPDNGLWYHEVYQGGGKGFPLNYGNILNISATGAYGGSKNSRTQLLMEWPGVDFASLDWRMPRMYYRAARDLGADEFTPWDRIATSLSHMTIKASGWLAVDNGVVSYAADGVKTISRATSGNPATPYFVIELDFDSLPYNLNLLNWQFICRLNNNLSFSYTKVFASAINGDRKIVVEFYNSNGDRVDPSGPSGWVDFIIFGGFLTDTVTS